MEVFIGAWVPVPGKDIGPIHYAEYHGPGHVTSVRLADREFKVDVIVPPGKKLAMHLGTTLYYVVRNQDDKE